MKKLNYLFLLLLVILSKSEALFAQNNLAAGDLAIVSYQSDTDPTNTFNTSLLEFDDRFSIVVLKAGGLAAGTVIYITDRGWDGPNNIWLDEAYPPNTFGLGSEAVIKWVVPAGGIIQGKEVFFINKYHDELPAGSEYYQWFAYSDESGTIPLGTITNETPIVPTSLPLPNGFTDGISLFSAGDNILIFQTGPPAGAPTNYNDAIRRFITAILANIRPTNVGTPTSYAAWDVAPNVQNESSIPPGLVNGQTCFLMSPGPLPQLTSPVPGTVEPDNGKFSNSALSLVGTCTALQMSTLIYTTSNWTYSNNVFPVGTSSSLCTYTFLSLVSYSKQPTAVLACPGLPVSFDVIASGGGTLSYQWQESANNTFSSPTTLGNTGVYGTTNTNTLNISDNSSLNGKYYRAIVTGACGAANSNGALLTHTAPTLSSNTTVSQAVGAQNNLYYTPACGIISKVVPSGANPISNNLTAQVWVESAVPTVGTSPLVQRHFQLTPSTNAASATGTVTLYFSQTEFDNFNANPNSSLNLPTGPADAAGKANLRVAKYGGSSNDGSGLPSSYTSTNTVIDPVDANIIWNAAFSRWEITVEVTGFSGFFVQTNSNIALPVKLVAFSAKINAEKQAQIEWKVAEQVGIQAYTVEKSSDAKIFMPLGIVKANNTRATDYFYFDSNLINGNNYYRLKISEQTGETYYSKTVTVAYSREMDTKIFPNPVTDFLNISSIGTHNLESAELFDTNGKSVLKTLIIDRKPINLKKIPEGLYFLRLSNGETYKILKR